MNREMNRGFTLIELLVVIAIIAILAALLFPVFMTARDAAYQTKCVSNLKQLSMGVSFYADSYNGTLPPCELYIDEGHPSPRWPLLIYPYLRTPGVLMCPQYNKAIVATYTASQVNGQSAYVNYGMNSEIGFTWNTNPNGNANLWTGMKMSSIGKNIVMLAETTRYIRQSSVRGAPSVPDWLVGCGFFICNPQGVNDPLTKYYMGSALPGAIHRGTSTVVYTDGHVRSAQASTLIGQYPERWTVAWSNGRQ